MEYNIDTIQSMTEQDAQSMASESMNIKGFTVYMVDFGGCFGYSALVFKNGHHIYYANDYELHHRATSWSEGMSGEKLRAWYIQTLNNKLFTDEEIRQPLTCYDEYKRKEYFIMNYYPMQVEHLSIFGIFNTEREKKKFPYYSPAAFAYFKDKAFVELHMALYDALQKQYENTGDNYEYQKSAFKHEMYNHEYAINWQADWDTLSAFGNIPWRGDGEEARELYFKDLGFTETQKRAYRDALREYWDEDARRND